MKARITIEYLDETLGKIPPTVIEVDHLDLHQHRPIERRHHAGEVYSELIPGDITTTISALTLAKAEPEPMVAVHV